MSQDKVVSETENLLHATPALYEAFYSGEETSMAYFLCALFDRYRPGKRILDVGCGLGREVAYLCKQGYEVDGLDNSEEMLQWAENHYPALTFIRGNLSTYVGTTRYDALYCVGSSFMYNETNEAAIHCLKCFRENLRKGGLLYLDMRNAAIFLTEKGQRRLREVGTEETLYCGEKASVAIKLSIELKSQILNREYHWQIPGKEPITERLQHRLFFPQELVLMLESSGFQLIRIFDQPDAHNGYYQKGDQLNFSENLTGSRLQILAEAR